MAYYEAPGSLNGFEKVHSNVTNPCYLGPNVKTRESSWVLVWKNIQKSELRPLHKFEQNGL